MTKKLAILTKSNIKFLKVVKTTRPCAVDNDRLYFIGDGVCIAQDDDDVHVAFYNIDSTQPLGHGRFLPTSLVKAYIRSFKMVGKKATVFNFSLNKLIPVIILICLGMSALYVFMR